MIILLINILGDIMEKEDIDVLKEIYQELINMQRITIYNISASTIKEINSRYPRLIYNLENIIKKEESK